VQDDDQTQAAASLESTLVAARRITAARKKTKQLKNPNQPVVRETASARVWREYSWLLTATRLRERDTQDYDHPQAAGNLDTNLYAQSMKTSS
jgi:hypothetical protein